LEKARFVDKDQLFVLANNSYYSENTACSCDH